MELSPLEIKSQKFPRKLKGYDVTEVDNFLELIAKDLEKLYGEFYNLKEDIVKKNQEIKEFKEKDKMISDAVLMVRSIGDEIKIAARSEAESIKNNAIMEAKRIIDEAYAKYSEIYLSANELLNKRVLILNSMKNLLSTNIDLVNLEESKKLELSLSAKDKNIIDNLADALKTDKAYKNKSTGNNEKNFDYNKTNDQKNINDNDEDNADNDDKVLYKNNSDAPNNQTEKIDSNLPQEEHTAINEEEHKKIEDYYNDKDKKNDISGPEKEPYGKDDEELEKLLGDVNKFTF
ncbi:MAG: DivIVA domain-containing protein [Deltaproteobacteria bacterium]|nr:DivIVA domain-containing protein [Deltaproteobacteria bacterium]